MHKRNGFTLVEILICIVLIALLASITVLGYGTWQHRMADNTVRSDISQATSGLTSYNNFKNDYPPNFAGINFASSDMVALTLRTNAPQLRTYENLSQEQNAQLFLNACNANMPTSPDGSGQPRNTACAFSGNNLHISGTQSANVIISGPSIDASAIQLTCGSPCTTALAAMKSQFLDQNGSFPLSVPKKQVSLPAPVITTYGSASLYCLEGRSVNFDDIVYHSTSQNKSIVSGPCPENAELHYP